MVIFLIIKQLGLYTRKDLLDAAHEAREKISEERRKYYQNVIKELQTNGSLPAGCDLVLPKESIVIKNSDSGEVIAEGGKWIRTPNDGELIRVTYTQQ